jgi:hypothetical protein
MRTGFWILTRLLSGGMHGVWPLDWPGIEFATYDEEGRRILLGEEDIKVWTVAQVCELVVPYVHQKGSPTIVYRNHGLTPDGVIKNTFFPDTNYGRSIAQEYLDQLEALELTRIEEKLQINNKAGSLKEAFKFPPGVSIRKLNKARYVLSGGKPFA